MLAANKVFAANKIIVIKHGNESIEKSVKLKTWKLFKSQKSAKLRKKSSKIAKSHSFNIKKNELSFLALKAIGSFNYL